MVAISHLRFESCRPPRRCVWAGGKEWTEIDENTLVFLKTIAELSDRNLLLPHLRRGGEAKPS